MPERSGGSKSRGTMLHQVYSGKRDGEPPQKQKRLMARNRKAAGGQPILSKNRKPKDRLFGGS